MANSIQGNVFVIDSQGVYLTQDYTSASAYPRMMISNVGLFGVDSTGELALSYQSNTTQVIYHLRCPADGGYADIHFAVPHMVSERLYVNTISAGTGYIYLA